MWKLFDFAAARAAVLALALFPFAAQAAPAQVERFTAHTWAQFQSGLQRPAIVVFSTTDCIYCPSVIADLAQEIEQRKAPIPLVVVVMDGDGKPALLRDPEYQKASRLFVFSGPGAALQYSINPKWRGVTPYVALFGAHGAPQLVTGRPPAAAIERWLSTDAGDSGRDGK
jgi:thiol-disulfide isomerase/thioredoxin